MQKRAGLHTGWNRTTGRPVTLGWDRIFYDHVLMLGKTNMGKTTLLEYWVRQMVKAKHGVALFDPEGTIFKKVLSFLYRINFPPEKIHIVDLTEKTYCPGLDYFDMGDEPADVVADLILEAFGKITHQTDEYKPLIERYGRAALIPMKKAGVPLGFLPYVIQVPLVRQAVLARANDDYANLNWKAWGERSTRDQASDLIGILNRADIFAKSEEHRAVFSASRNAVDWRQAMDNGDVVLVNLYHSSQQFAQLVGVTLIHQLSKAARSRPEGSRHFFTIVDEFSQFLTDDFRKAVKLFRKRGVHFVFSTQDLDDLMGSDGTDRALYNSIINATGTKIVFSMLNFDYCLELARHLFASMITGERVKYWGEHPVWKPIPKTEEVEIHTESSTETMPGAVHSHSETHADDDWGDGEVITTDGLTEGDPSYSSSQSTTRSTQRYTDYEERIIKETPVFRSVEEELLLYAKWVFAQGCGECQVLYDSKKPPIPVRTPAPGSPVFKKAFAKREDVQQYLDNVYRVMALPTYNDAHRLFQRKLKELEQEVVDADVEETYDQPQSNPLPEDEGENGR